MVRQPFDGAARDPEIAGRPQLFDHVPQLRPAGAPLGAVRLHLSLRRGAGGHIDGGPCASHRLGPGIAVHRHGRRGQRVQGRLCRQARTQMRLRRRGQQCAARLRFADREPVHDRHGPVDGCQGIGLDRTLIENTEAGMDHSSNHSDNHSGGGSSYWLFAGSSRYWFAVRRDFGELLH